MKASNLAVNWAMRLRRSSKPKLMLGSESAIDGASAEASGGRMPLVESDGSKEAILQTVIWVMLVVKMGGVSREKQRGCCCGATGSLSISWKINPRVLTLQPSSFWTIMPRIYYY